MKKAVTITALVLALASAGMAQPRHGGGKCDGHGGGPGHAMQQQRFNPGFPGVRKVLRHAEELNLTDEQTGKLEDMLPDFQTEKIDREADLKKARVELMDLIRTEADEAKVMVAIDRVAELRADLNKMRYRHHMAVKDLLTDDQIEQIKEMRGRWADGGGMRLRDGSGPGPRSGRRGG